MTIADTGSGNARVNVGGYLSSALSDLLLNDSDIAPGSAPGYQLCKTIYNYHPLGAKLADMPITLAQSQPREIDMGDVIGAEMLVEAFEREWEATNIIGATKTIHNFVKTSRIYGISSLGVGERGKDPAEPLEIGDIADADLFFNVFDPLNTAGSLVLNQDPNAPDFLKPDYIRVQGKTWHPSRTCIVMNEQPVYIEYSTSAFGFVGRSVYQRSLYPLRTFVQSMVTDQLVTQKAGLLVAKMKSPGSIISNAMQTMFGWKTGNLKAGVTGQVLSMGVDESAETLDMKNLEGPARFARENMLKNIATAAGMPAAMVNEETLTKGFGEGSEDAKQIARYIDAVREDMQPAYAFMDNIVQRRAWSPAFFETMKNLYPEYKKMTYDTALMMWRTKFHDTWPNLLAEPESEVLKGEGEIAKAAIAAFEVLTPRLDPENNAAAAAWLQDVMNSLPKMFGANQMTLDVDALREWTPPSIPEHDPDVESSRE